SLQMRFCVCHVVRRLYVRLSRKVWFEFGGMFDREFAGLLDGPLVEPADRDLEHALLGRQTDVADVTAFDVVEIQNSLPAIDGDVAENFDLRVRACLIDGSAGGQQVHSVTEDGRLPPAYPPRRNLVRVDDVALGGGVESEFDEPFVADVGARVEEVVHLRFRCGRCAGRAAGRVEEPAPGGQADDNGSGDGGACGGGGDAHVPP